MIEYTIIVGIITLVLYYMGTSIKRGMQSLIKVTADQVGNQANSDQDFTDSQEGYLIVSNTETQANKIKQVTEIGYIPQVAGRIMRAIQLIMSLLYTMTNTISNGGFTPSN